MKVAIVGSRDIRVKDLENYIPKEVTEIVSGGAVGVDTCAKEYALENQIEYIEFLPDYHKYGRRAPIVRNDLIIEYADIVLAFWDGKSRGTKYVVETCKKKGREIRVILVSSDEKNDE